MAKKATKTETNKTSTFFDILNRDNNEVQKERAKFITASAVKHFNLKAQKLQSEIDEINIELKSMLDITTSNNTTTLNAIKEFDHKGFVEKRAKLRMERFLKKQELKLFLEDSEFYNIDDKSLVIEDQ